MELFTVICLIQHLLAFLYLYNVDSTPWRYGDLFRSAASSLITSFLPTVLYSTLAEWHKILQKVFIFFFFDNCKTEHSCLVPTYNHSTATLLIPVLVSV